MKSYAFLAGAMAKMGDYSPNVPIYMTPASLGHLRRWASLPFCADAMHEGGLLEDGHRVRSDEEGKGEARSGEDTGGRGEASERVIRAAVRRLIGYANTEDEQEQLRLCALNGCC